MTDEKKFGKHGESNDVCSSVGLFIGTLACIDRWLGGLRVHFWWYAAGQRDDGEEVEVKTIEAVLRFCTYVIYFTFLILRWVLALGGCSGSTWISLQGWDDVRSLIIVTM